jgi:hypothetical protein
VLTTAEISFEIYFTVGYLVEGHTTAVRTGLLLLDVVLIAK